MNILERLHEVERSLTDGPFNFESWTQCTCGHIYTAAEGALVREQDKVESPDDGSRYAELINAVATALGYEGPSRECRSAALYVSRYTHNVGGNRIAALATVRRAIESIEADQRLSMQIAALRDPHEGVLAA